MQIKKSIMTTALYSKASSARSLLIFAHSLDCSVLDKVMGSSSSYATSSQILVKGVLFVVFVGGKLVEDFRVRIGQELIGIEGITNRVVTYPSSLLTLIRLTLLLGYVVPEFVIGNYESVELFRILDAIGIIIVLRRSLDDETLIS
jgi:hypothetical protein